MHTYYSELPKRLKKIALKNYRSHLRLELLGHIEQTLKSDVSAKEKETLICSRVHNYNHPNAKNPSNISPFTYDGRYVCYPMDGFTPYSLSRERTYPLGRHTHTHSISDLECTTIRTEYGRIRWLSDGYVFDLRVYEEHKGKGLSKLLLAEAPKNNYLVCYPKLKSYYEHLGYTFAGEGKNVIIMVKGTIKHYENALKYV